MTTPTNKAQIRSTAVKIQITGKENVVHNGENKRHHIHLTSLTILNIYSNNICISISNIQHYTPSTVLTFQIVLVLY